MPGRELTPRQQQIVRAIALGETNREIARNLGVCEQTVKWHVSRLLRAHGASNRAALVELLHGDVHDPRPLARTGPTRASATIGSSVPAGPFGTSDPTSASAGLPLGGVRP